MSSLDNTTQSKSPTPNIQIRPSLPRFKTNTPPNSGAFRCLGIINIESYNIEKYTNKRPPSLWLPLMQIAGQNFKFKTRSHKTSRKPQQPHVQRQRPVRSLRPSPSVIPPSELQNSPQSTTTSSVFTSTSNTINLVPREDETVAIGDKVDRLSKPSIPWDKLKQMRLSLNAFYESLQESSPFEHYSVADEQGQSGLRTYISLRSLMLCLVCVGCLFILSKIRHGIVPAEASAAVANLRNEARTLAGPGSGIPYTPTAKGIKAKNMQGLVEMFAQDLQILCRNTEPVFVGACQEMLEIQENLIQNFIKTGKNAWNACEAVALCSTKVIH